MSAPVPAPVLRVVQCWDDGILDDIRLTEILRRHGARASFNLNAGLHRQERYHAFTKQGREIWRLSWAELPAVYQGFTIANHSLTHPRPTQISLPEWTHQVVENRRRLQDHFGAPIAGFAYPFGGFDEATGDVVRQAGHLYARTTKNATPCFPPADPMAFAPDCHFRSPHFWTLYEQARSAGGVFYFWGHSYEMHTEEMWAAFEAQIARISADPHAQWADLPALFGS